MRLDRRTLMKLGCSGAGALGVGGPAMAEAVSGFSIVDLRVCGAETPLALGARTPRFSWKLAGGDAALTQGAYRITVARSEEDLAAGRDLVWDSGQIRSDATFDIAFAGPPTPSRARFWCRVEAWDGALKRRAVSRPATWETGLAEPSDWTAQWLASEDETARLDREAGLHWITGPERLRADGHRYYRTTIEAPRGTTGVLLLSAPSLDGVWLNGEVLTAEDADPMRWTTMATYRLRLRPGRNVLAASQGRSMEFGALAPVLAAIVRLTDAKEHTRRLTSAAGWKTSIEAPADWTSPGFDDRAWTDATEAKTKPQGEPWPAASAMHLRREFQLPRPVKSARLYATALGGYEAWINGARVGDRRMTPEPTDTSKRVLYQAYDVTALLRPGDNALGLWVGDSWYGSEFSNGSRFSFGPAPRRVLAQLEVTYADGSSEIVRTGKGWTTAPSAVRSSEIYDGEVYDARQEQPGWASAGFATEDWRPAELAPAPSVAVEPQVAPPIRVTQTLAPAKITESRPGVYVVDFGQNFAGWARLRVRGPAGTKVEMLFAKVLKPSGEADQANLRTAFARDTYILKGDGEEIWEPRFTYHGFRYVELRGLPQAPTQETLTGMVAHTDLPFTGVFRVGDPVIERFWRNSVWSQRSNFFGLPTDCPQRDERLGWMGDAQVFWPAAAFNMDVAAYTARVMEDARHGQSKAGAFPDCVPPFSPQLALNSPGWADAGVILPHTAWRQYGDTGVIRENWAAMERYLAYVEARNPDHIWTKARGADYADWLAVDAKNPGDPTTPKDLIGTAYWAADAAMMAEMAAAIGRPEDAQRYRALFETIRGAFLKAYAKADGKIGNDSQTSYVLPIRFGLLPPKLHAEAGRRLAANVASRGDKLSTGFLGTPHILDALADTGQEDAAVTLLLQRQYPSWGYMVEKGATTMWERWNSDTGDVSMNSYNHYAFGAITAFLFRRIAGIAPAEPGFRRVRIAPIFDRRLGHAGADYDSIAGRIHTVWRFEGEALRLEVSLPANTSGEVVLPGRRSQIRLDGRPLPGGVRSAEREGATQVLVGPGTYAFTVQPRRA